MKDKRIYTAWDNKKDEHRLFTGLSRLTNAGIRPHHIMVYMLINYWPGETDDDWEYRRAKLRDFGARPYPMRFARTQLATGFQRFCVGAYDKRFSWEAFKAADCRPEKLGVIQPFLSGASSKTAKGNEASPGAQQRQFL
jgi:hypothetical protein